MNILVLSWRGPGHPNAGGAEISTHEHSKAWIKAGHRVWLFTSTYDGAKRQETIDEVETVRIGGQTFFCKFTAFFWYFWGKHPKFDIVVDEFHGIPFFTPLYVRARKIGWIHEATKKDVWKLNPWPKPFNLIPATLGPLLEPFIFSFLYRDVSFMTVSRSTKEDLVKWGIPRKNVTVIENGVSLKAKPKKLPAKEKKKTAMYLGAISHDKGIADAIKVFSLLNKQDSSWRFWIAGKESPEMGQFLAETVKRYRLEKKLKYWGYVSERKKFELLAKAHVLVNPSIHEGWGLVNIEANSVSTPVVGYNVHGVRDSVKDKKTGFLVPWGKVTRMAKAISRLTSNKNLYRKISKNALEFSKQFSWDIARQKSLEIIELR